MMNIFNNAASPFYRFGQIIVIQKIKKEGWMKFIISSFQKTGKEISDALASRICDVVECHSWYIQQLCYFVWSFTTDCATEEIVNRGVEQVLNINTTMFQSDTDNLMSTQKEMLKAIATGEQRLSFQDTKAKYQICNPIVRNKRMLQSKGIIEESDARLTFIDPAYKLWNKTAL